MPRDIQFDILDKIRATGVREAVTLHLSRPDAARVVAGSQTINSSIQGPDDVHILDGSADSMGQVSFRLDDNLPKGVGAIENRFGQRTNLSLVDVIP